MLQTPSKRYYISSSYRLLCTCILLSLVSMFAQGQNNQQLSSKDSLLYQLYSNINEVRYFVKEFRTDPTEKQFDILSKQVSNIKVSLDTALKNYTALKQLLLKRSFTSIENDVQTFALANENPTKWSLLLLQSLRNFQLEISLIPGIQQYITFNDTTTTFVNPDWLDIYFKSDTITYQAGKFAFNILTIRNLNNGSKDFEIQYHFPTGFSPLSTPLKGVQLIPKEEKNIPIRLQSNGQQLSALTKYNVVVSLFDKKTGLKVAVKNFTIQPEKKREWTARLVNSNQFFTVGVKEVPFSLSINNTGTVTEHVALTVIANNSIHVNHKPDSIHILPGTDTIITLSAKLPLGYKNSVQSYTIGIKLNTERKSYSFNQKIVPVGTTLKVAPTPFRTFKGYVELNSQNVNKENKQFFFNTQGSMSLPRNRSLFYSYRNNYITTAYGVQTGSLINVNYYSKRFKLFVGDQNELYNSILNGFGVKTQLHLGAHDQVEIIGLKQRKEDIVSTGIKHQRIFSDETTLNSTFEFKDNNEKSIQHSIYTSSLSHQFNDSLKGTLEIGYGNENQNNDSINRPLGVGGFHGASTLEWQGKNVESSIALNSSNKDFPGFTKGVNSARANVRYKYSQYALGPRVRFINNQRQTITPDSIRLDGKFSTQDFEFDMQRKLKLSVITLTPGYVFEKQDSIKTTVSKIKLSGNFRWKKLAINWLGYYGEVKYPDYADKRTNRLSLNLSSNLNNGGINFRYKQGPFYSSESKVFINTGTITKSLAILPYYNWYSKNGKLWVTTTGEARKESDTWQYLLRNSVSYQWKFGINTRVYMSYRLSEPNNEDFIVNLSVKKNITIPVPFAREFSKLNLLLYKDVNANNEYDSETDELIKNATVKVGNHYLQTDSLGKAALKNIPLDIYPVDLSLIPNLRGWISGLGSFHSVAVGKKPKKHEIPFIKAKVITGIIVIDKDKYSAYRFDLSNIRVTAKDTLGNTFHAFTNNEAQFTLNVPVGSYTISFNETLFIEQFRVVNNHIPVNLGDAESYDIQFKVTEKRRKVNIRR